MSKRYLALTTTGGLPSSREREICAVICRGITDKLSLKDLEAKVIEHFPDLTRPEFDRGYAEAVDDTLMRQLLTIAEVLSALPKMRRVTILREFQKAIGLG